MTLEDLRLGELSEGFTGTSSLSTTNDDETCSTTTESMFYISPNGRFRRKIRSWNRGVLLPCAPPNRRAGSRGAGSGDAGRARLGTRRRAPARPGGGKKQGRSGRRWETKLTDAAHLAVREAAGPSCQRGTRQELGRGTQVISRRTADRALPCRADLACHVGQSGKNVRSATTVVLNMKASF